MRLLTALALGLLSFAFSPGKIIAQDLPVDFQKIELLTGLKNSVGFAIAPDGRIFMLDRYGEILLFKPETQTLSSAGTLPTFFELEDGLLGIAFDPDFLNNQYVYLNYSPLPENFNKNRVSRFKIINDTISIASEVVILEWDTQRSKCCHSGGDLDFDSQGNLYISTGDNTNHSPYATLNEEDINESSENTSSNTNDLRGKILRIHPEADGSYTIPSGNLFPNGVGGREEIYVMGVRNAFKIYVDAAGSDWLFWADVGPDANHPSNLGPVGLDEINLTKEAGNYGWPYFSGDNIPYQNTYSSPSFYYDPQAPVNLSTWNTGSVNLPPAKGSMIDRFHASLMSGPVYHFDSEAINPKKLPFDYNDRYFYFDFNKSIIWSVKLDENGNLLENTELPTDVLTGSGFIDMHISPDGTLYMLEYGAGCCPGNVGTGKLVRFDYIGSNANRSPVVTIEADKLAGALPLTVNFSSAGTFDPDGDPVTYEWDFDSDGNVDSNEENPTHTYTAFGSYSARLIVRDTSDGVASKSITIFAGSEPATFNFMQPVDGGLFNWFDEISFDIEVNDPEDGSTSDNSIDCADLTVTPSIGHLDHFHDISPINDCSGSMDLIATGHDIEGEMDIFMVLNTNYTDEDGLTSFDQIRIHPKRKSAEYFDQSNKVKLIKNYDPIGGPPNVVNAEAHGAFLTLVGRNLLGIDSVSYRVAAKGGAIIELRAGGLNGTLISTTTVPATGTNEDWTNVTSAITDPGGKNDLYFIFEDEPGKVDILNLNYIEFIGDGVSEDKSAPFISEVIVPNNASAYIKFNERIQAGPANLLANYSLTGGANINSVALQPDGRTVLLNTSELAPDVEYNLTINNMVNVGDVAAGSLLDIVKFEGSRYRINAGGGAVSINGNFWQEDEFATGGSSYSNPDIEVTGTGVSELFKTERFGNYSYNIPLPEGFYTLELHFAEIYLGIKAPGGVGDRIFNVDIEDGQASLDEFDIYEEAGGPAIAVLKRFEGIEVTDGFLTISLSSLINNPKLSGIEILAGEAVTTPSIEITRPDDNVNVPTSFDIFFEIENWDVGEGTTHFHLFIDDVNQGGVYSFDPIRLENMDLGDHTIRLELYNPDHSGTGIFDEINVTVVEGDACLYQPFPEDFQRINLGDELPYNAVFILAEDMDGDSLKDIVTGGWWYKNPGDPFGTWEQKVIGDPFKNVSYILDIDEDGDYDLFGTQGTPSGTKMAWAQNDGNGNFTIYKNIPVGNQGISGNFTGGVAFGEFEPGKRQFVVAWNESEIDGTGLEFITIPDDPVNTLWDTTRVPGTLGEGLDVGYIDGDDRLDIFQGGNWLRNDGNGNWTVFETGITLPSYYDRNLLADLDGDGDLDGIITQIGSAKEVVMAENPDDPTQPWPQTTIGNSVDGGLSADVADMDGDGDMDVIVGEWKNSFRILGFENDLCNTGAWIQRNINAGNDGEDHHDGSIVVDIDNDDDLDVISIGWSERTPRIYLNETQVRNRAPQVNAGIDKMIMLPFSAVTMTATASDDGLPNGNLMYQWSALGANAGNVSFSEDDILNPTVSFSGPGTYELMLMAMDGELSAMSHVFVTVKSNEGLLADFVLYRVNSGGPAITAIDGGLDWEEDTSPNPSQYLVNRGSNSTNSFGVLTYTQEVDTTVVPPSIYDTERADEPDGDEMSYLFPVQNGTYLVNLYVGNGWPGTLNPGSRIFSVEIEGEIPTNLTDVDLSDQFGHQVGSVISNVVTVTDGKIDITFLHGAVQNPLVNGIEILGEAEDFPIVFEPLEDQRNIVGDNVSLNITALGGDPSETFTYTITGQPNGITLTDPATGEFGGVIAAGAQNGGPNSDGVYTVIVSADKPSSDIGRDTFIWSIFTSQEDLLDTWVEIPDPTANSHTPRQDNGFIQVGERFYLIGGRNSGGEVEVFDYDARLWSEGASAPVELNSFQPINFEGYIWVIGALQTSNFPTATPAANVYVYDPIKDVWNAGPEIPNARRRGAAGAVEYNGKFYMVGGNTTGNNGVSVPWFDEYDPTTGIWTTLTDAPRARDHFQAFVYANKLYLISGRQSGGTGGVYGPLVPEIDVYDFVLESWSTLIAPSNLPTPRANASVLEYEGDAFIIGGEIGTDLGANDINDAVTTTETFDLDNKIWTTRADMNFKRQGTQAIASGDGIITTSGSPGLGAGSQTNMEYYGLYNPSGPKLVASTLTGPFATYFTQGGTETITLSVSGGNQGVFVKSFEIVGTDAAKFTIVTGGTNGIVLDPDKNYQLQISLDNNSPDAVAQLVITLGDDSKGFVDLLEGEAEPFPIYINAGGPDYVADNGVTFVSDRNFTVSNTYETDSPIGSTVDDSLYQTERFGEFEYAIPVVNGSYDIALHFAELYIGVPGAGGLGTGIGDRIFDVEIEGATFFDDVDLFEEVGPLAAVIKVAGLVEVTDDTLNIKFIPVNNFAKVSAIGITPSALAVDTDGDGILDNVDTCPTVFNPDQTLPMYFADGDKDGFGHPDSMVQTCIAPDGFVANNLDCDDTNDQINPSAADVVNDLIDQNCDGRDSFLLVDQVMLMATTSAPQPISQGATFSVTFMVNSGVQPFNEVGLHVTFDPNVLRVAGFTQGTALDQVITPVSFDNGQGTLDFEAKKGTGTLVGTANVITVTFLAVASDTTYINFTGGANDSYVDLGVNPVLSMSPELELVIGLATSIRELDGTERSVALFPNPVADVLNITIKGKPGEEMQLRVSDMKGQLVHQELITMPSEEANFKLDSELMQLPVGVYSVQLVSESFSYPAKSFIKK